MSRRPSAAAPVETDLTSMIDVVFLMIVFFLCTLSFRLLEGRLDTRLPKDEGARPGPAAILIEPLDLEVVRDASRTAGVAVRVQGTRVMDVDALSGFVTRFVASADEPRARISTGQGVTYGEVVAVLDACLLGGLYDLSFVASAL
ncbi:MAG: ExbD/TolR family protein [Planctomycetota bacterium]|jgi:biopolymer transport protein ExbD